MLRLPYSGAWGSLGGWEMIFGVFCSILYRFLPCFSVRRAFTEDISFLQHKVARGVGKAEAWHPLACWGLGQAALLGPSVPDLGFSFLSAEATPGWLQQC